MNIKIIFGILIPFIGTALGAACVLVMKNSISDMFHRVLSALAAGVMLAASIFSLLIPSMEYTESSAGIMKFLPTIIGFWVGLFFFVVLEKIVHHMHDHHDDHHTGFSCGFKMVFAMILHNIPEGMALGVLFAGVIREINGVTLAAAFSLAIGVAIHNFPVGAVISLPLHAEGLSKPKSFLLGLLVGIVEPVATLLTILAASAIMPIYPYLLAFAAGAMMFVVIDDLIPEMTKGKHSNLVTSFFACGFTIMLIMEMILG